MSCIAISKEQREQAQRDKLHIIQIAIDRKYATENGGRWAITGAYPKEMADELRALIERWHQEDKL